MIYGIDALGLAKYPKIINYWHTGFACGVFANTFGNVWPALRQLANSGRCPLIRIHAVWEDNHEYKPNKHNSIILAELDKTNKEAEANKDVQFQFSPFCEHTLSGVPLKNLMKLCLDNKANNVQIVNTPWTGKYYFHEDVINECHGNKTPPKDGRYNFSFDGLACVDADIEKYKSERANAGVFFFWTYQCNGKKSAKDNTPRPQRKAWPTKELIDSLVYLACIKQACDLPPKWLWKSHSEQHTVPAEPRALKPVLICPIKQPHFQLRRNGTLIATSSSALPYEDGRYRYYFGEYGYKLDACKLMSNGVEYGSVDCGYRINEYRNK